MGLLSGSLGATAMASRGASGDGDDIRRRPTRLPGTPPPSYRGAHRERLAWLGRHGAGRRPSEGATVGDIRNHIERAGATAAVDRPSGASALDELVATVALLRAPGGCPWDAEQTHESLVQYLVEESWELIDAIEAGDRDEMIEELGDVLYQVLFHADLAAHTPGEDFDIEDVAAHMTAKMVSRHPHVFGGDRTAETADDVVVVLGRAEGRREAASHERARRHPARHARARARAEGARQGREGRRRRRTAAPDAAPPAPPRRTSSAARCSRSWHPPARRGSTPSVRCATPCADSRTTCAPPRTPRPATRRSAERQATRLPAGSRRAGTSVRRHAHTSAPAASSACTVSPTNHDGTDRS